MTNDEDILSSRLTDILAKGLSDGGLKSLKKSVDELIYQIESDIDFRLKDELAPNLSTWVVAMSKQSIEQLLSGNEDQMRRYLSCEKRDENGEYRGWTGRSDSQYWGRQLAPSEWHSVIHGQLFEQGALALRKKIVEAHRDLLVNERILDLEDQVRSLVAQNNKLNVEREQLLDQLRGAA